jgi:hypothetical protein
MKKLSITITVLAMAGAAQVASASNFCVAVNDLGPVGYWQFEGDWTDYTDSGNHLTGFIHGGGTPGFTPGPGHAGMPGDAADFRHGGGQRGAYATTGAGNPLTLAGAGGYTINAWVSNDETGGSWAFTAVERDSGWCCGPNGWNYGLAHYRAGSIPQSGFKTWIQGSNASLEPIPIIDADWHMLTVSATLANGTASLYLDGVFAGSFATGGASMAGDGEYFQVANPINPITNAAVPENYTANDLNGRIDELAVFDYALSATEISNLYAAAFIAGGPCTEPGLIPSDDFVVTNVVGTTFSSKSNETYSLQSTPDLVSSNFSDTGAIVIGNGGDMTLFDPTGPSTSKNYRVKLLQ